MLDKILEEIENLPVITDMDDGQLLKYVDVEDIIRKHMNDGWIPCEERMPNHDLDVEVTGKDGERAVAHYSKENEMWFDTIYNRIIDVIAWKEPSEPYRPEKGGQR